MKIICIGLNYKAHIEEMNASLPLYPVFFMKPDTALLRNNDPFFYPNFTEDLQYETEIVLKINKVGRSISEKTANRYYSEIGLGIDFTARDIQRQCMAKGLPWEQSKAFDYSAPVSPYFCHIAELGDLDNISFRLDIDGHTVQTGNSSDMVFNFDQIVSYVSKFVTLKIGDLIFTGTPASVGKVSIGNRLQAYMNDKLMLDFEIK